MEQEDAMGQGCRASAGLPTDPGQEQPGLLQVSNGVCLPSREVTVCIWPSPGEDGDTFPFIRNHSCLHKMANPDASGNLQGSSHTRPLCGGSIGWTCQHPT